MSIPQARPITRSANSTVARPPHIPCSANRGELAGEQSRSHTRPLALVRIPPTIRLPRGLDVLPCFLPTSTILFSSSLAGGVRPKSSAETTRTGKREPRGSREEVGRRNKSGICGIHEEIYRRWHLARVIHAKPCMDQESGGSSNSSESVATN